VKGDGQVSNKQLRIEALAVHAGRSVDSAIGAMVAPSLTTTFERDEDGAYHHERFEDI
jgi:hypothetical protein